MPTGAVSSPPSHSRRRFWRRADRRPPQSGGAGSPGERAVRRRSLPAGRAQRLPAAASPRLPGQLLDVHAAQPGPLPGGRLGAAGAAHGDQRPGHARQLKGQNSLCYSEFGRLCLFFFNPRLLFHNSCVISAGCLSRCSNGVHNSLQQPP